ARVSENAARLCDLVRIAEVGDLGGSHSYSTHLAEQRTDVVADGAGHLLPRCSEVFAALVDVLTARVGEDVRASVARMFGAHEALVLELRQRRIDGSRARPPETVRPLLDLLHDLVPVERSLGEQQEGGCAYVATARPRARPATRLQKRARTLRPARTRAHGDHRRAGGPSREPRRRAALPTRARSRATRGRWGSRSRTNTIYRNSSPTQADPVSSAGMDELT